MTETWARAGAVAHQVPPPKDTAATNITPDTLSISVGSVGSVGPTTTHTATATATDQDSQSAHDTFGLHYEDQPWLGGVFPDAERSCGGVSAITGPDQYVVPAQIKVPELTPINELELPPNCPSIVDGQENDQGSIIFSDECRRTLARRSLEAGLDASKSFAFDIAADHFMAGRKELGPNGWSVDPKTMLDLTSEGANASYRAGDVNQMDELIEDVLGRELSIEEKFRAYETKMLAEQAAGNYRVSVSLGLDVRRKLGLSAPPNKPVSTISSLAMYLRTKLALGRRTSEEIASLPILADKRQIMGQRMMEFILTGSYPSQPTLFPLCTFLMVNASLRYGINASSCEAFSNFGVILCAALGDPQRGREMGKAAELIVAKPGMSQKKCRTIFKNHGFLYHWTSSLQATLDPLLEGYRIGLDIGDNECAGWCLGLRLAHLFYSGRPLCDSAVADTIALHVDNQHWDKYTELFLQIYFIAIKKLRGLESEDGERGFDDIIKEANINFDTKTLNRAVFAIQLELQVLMGEWDQAEKLVSEDGDAKVAGPFAGVRCTFLKSLVCLKAAQSSSGITSWKWKRRALKSYKLIRGWEKAKSGNITHALHILNAELAVLEFNYNRAQNEYKSAIAVAARNGFLQDQALANELASSHFERRGLDCCRDRHLEAAIKCYSEWGAAAKVRLID